MRKLAIAAIVVLALVGCTAEPDRELMEALMCLTNAGVDATIEDGAIVITEYANDDPDAREVPQSVIDECLPEG